MKKRLATLAVAGAFVLSSCGEQYTFEAHPSGSDDDYYEGDPRNIKCFVIEADSSQGDDKDRQLGEYCKEKTPSDAARADMENEREDDD